MTKRFLLFLLCTRLFALPVENPAQPRILPCGVLTGEGYYNCYDEWYKSWSVRAGYFGEYLLDRKLQVDAGGNANHIDKTDLCTHAGLVVLNFCDRFDLFTSLGKSEIEIDAPKRAFVVTPPAEEGKVEIESEAAFSYRVGALFTLTTMGCFDLGVSGQYFRTSPKIDTIKVDGEAFTSSNDLTYTDWQLGAAISYCMPLSFWFSKTIPYIGATYSCARVDMSNIFLDQSSTFLVLFNLENAKTWGYAAGITFVGSGCWSLNVEGRLSDEEALYINAQFRF